MNAWLFWLLVSVFLVSLAVRDTYEALKESRRIDPHNRVVSRTVITAMILLWTSWFVLCRVDPHIVPLPAFLSTIGLLIHIGGTTLAVGALLQLRAVEDTRQLVTRGVFSKIRHPMYLGFIAWIVGWSLYQEALLSLGVGCACIASILWWRRLEERRLTVQFGDAYKTYQHATWF
jgi:protein-S-isoprenylcysteine O-methyltransferase Ste14